MLGGCYVRIICSGVGNGLCKRGLFCPHFTQRSKQVFLVLRSNLKPTCNVGASELKAGNV